MSAPNYVWSHAGIGADLAVMWNGERSEVVMTRKGRTHGMSVDTYSGGADGLSLAIYRARYLAGGVPHGFALVATEIAAGIVRKGPARAHHDWINPKPSDKE